MKLCVMDHFLTPQNKTSNKPARRFLSASPSCQVQISSLSSSSPSAHYTWQRWKNRITRGDCELYPNTNFIWLADKLPQPGEQRELMGAREKRTWTRGVAWLWLERSRVQRSVLMLTETHFRDQAVWLQGCELRCGLLSQFLSAIRSVDFVSLWQCVKLVSQGGLICQMMCTGLKLSSYRYFL